jgi:uncharacterized membrane protein YfcA
VRPRRCGHAGRVLRAVDLAADLPENDTGPVGHQHRRYLLVIIVGARCGCVTGAHLADAIGRKKTFMLFAVAASIEGALLRRRRAIDHPVQDGARRDRAPA